MKLRFAAAAEADLEAIGDWIARDNPRRAISFVLELRESCAPLVVMPEAYPVVRRFSKQNIRRKVHGNYLIFYVMDAEAVTVIRVLHGARDIDAVLIEDDGWE